MGHVLSIYVYKNLLVDNKDEGVRLLSRVLTEINRGNRNKL